MLLAVYGTLRKRERLDSWLNLEPLSTERLPGFEMYNLGSYPYVIRGEGEIVIEVYDAKTHTLNNIGDMEQGAGYKTMAVETSQGTALIFYMDTFDDANLQDYRQNPDGKYPQIIDGDWVKYRVNTGGK